VSSPYPCSPLKSQPLTDFWKSFFPPAHDSDVGPTLPSIYVPSLEYLTHVFFVFPLEALRIGACKKISHLFFASVRVCLMIPRPYRMLSKFPRSRFSLPVWLGLSVEFHQCLHFSKLGRLLLCLRLGTSGPFSLSCGGAASFPSPNRCRLSLIYPFPPR